MSDNMDYFKNTSFLNLFSDQSDENCKSLQCFLVHMKGYHLNSQKPEYLIPILQETILETD